MVEVENCRGVGAAAKFLTSRVSREFAEELFRLLDTDAQDVDDQLEFSYCNQANLVNSGTEYVGLFPIVIFD